MKHLFSPFSWQVLLCFLVKFIIWQFCMDVISFGHSHTPLPSCITIPHSGALLYNISLFNFYLFSNNLLSLIRVACLYMGVGLFTGSCTTCQWLLYWRKMTSLPQAAINYPRQGLGLLRPSPSHAVVLMGSALARWPLLCLWVQQLCHVQKTAFPSTLFIFLLIRVFYFLWALGFLFCFVFLTALAVQDLAL